MSGSRNESVALKAVLAVALILACFILLRVGARLLPAGARERRPARERAFAGAGETQERSRIAPARIPPMRLKRVEPRKGGGPDLPGTPMPPITPDRK